MKEVVEVKETKVIREKKEAPAALQYRPKVKTEVLPTEAKQTHPAAEVKKEATIHPIVEPVYH